MKRFRLLFLLAGILLAGATYATVSHAVGDRSLAPIDPTHQIVGPGHGTHLCTADEDCGVGHKCCEGHCLMVATCG